MALNNVAHYFENYGTRLMTDNMQLQIPQNTAELLY